MSHAAINDLWAELCEPLILEQYKDSSNLQALIKALIGAGNGDGFENVGQAFEAAINRLRTFYDVSTATGEILDIIGALRNLSRNIGESDAEYRSRINENCGIDNSGTPNYLIYMVQKKSGDPAPQYLEESETDAPTAFIYTPNGRQVYRAFVSAHTPAGVSGFPGAAICWADGSAILDANGKKFLAVADDDQVGSDSQRILTTEAGEALTTEMGEMLAVEFSLVTALNVTTENDELLTTETNEILTTEKEN